jgi:hypothetical protein
MSLIVLWFHPARYLFYGPMWRRWLAAWWLPRWASLVFWWHPESPCSFCDSYGHFTHEHTETVRQDGSWRQWECG